MLTVLLIALFTSVGHASQTVCNQDSWFTGFTEPSDSGMTMSAMDYCTVCDKVVIGGKYNSKVGLMLKDLTSDSGPQMT